MDLRNLANCRWQWQKVTLVWYFWTVKISFPWNWRTKGTCKGWARRTTDGDSRRVEISVLWWNVCALPWYLNVSPKRLKMTSNTHKLAYPRSRNILIYRNQSERGMPSWNRKAEIRGKFILCKWNHFVASEIKWHPQTKAARVRISPYKHETRSYNPYRWKQKLSDSN